MTTGLGIADSDDTLSSDCGYNCPHRPMFSQTTEYALRAAVYLAQEPERVRTTREIAEATSVPVDYLAKVMRSLVRAGLVRRDEEIRAVLCWRPRPRRRVCSMW